MKKVFTLLTALLIAGAVSAQSAWQKKALERPAAKPTHRATITPAANQAWWGYVESSVENVVGLGVAATDTYHCAIFIPGNHEVAGGKTIKAVRYYMPAPNVSDMKVWLAASLPATPTAATTLQLVNVANSEINSNGTVEVALPEGYTIPADGVYVGYSFTITAVQYQNDAYPIATTGSDAPNTLIIKTDSKVPSWSDMNGQTYGRLYLQVLLEGEFAQDKATPSAFDDVYVKVGESTTAKVPVINNGGNAISSLHYTITTDGVAAAEQEVTLATPIAAFATTEVEITVPGDAEQVMKQKTLTITKVNGNANTASQNSVAFNACSLNKIIDRNVVVEEFTGTGCGWCPRGLVGMDNLRNTFGDRFVGIGLHQYNSGDAMYIAKNSYKSLAFSGAPSCTIDRKAFMDPYYGTANDIRDDFRAEMVIPALVDVTVSGTLNEAMTQVAAKATVEALFDGNYTLEFVVIGDGLEGTGNAWNQANYYSQYSTSQMPDDLAMFGNGGKYGTSAISGWTFNDVALCSSYVSSVNRVSTLQLTSGAAQEVSYTLTMPTKATLRNAIKKDQLYVIALVIDAQGKIVQAAKAQVTDGTSGITAINGSSDAREVARYTADGRQVSAPQRGLNIIRLSDGTTRKVMVK